MTRPTPRLELFGSLTSPYVRRVRIVAHELGLELDWVDTTTEAGQAKLREVTPLWKVPTLLLDGEPVFDSAIIVRTLLQQAGPGPFVVPDPSDFATQNLITVIDGALDSLINTFYLVVQNGVSPDSAVYLKKQQERAAAALRWLDARVRGDQLGPQPGFGLPELALLTAIDWMRLRNAYPIERHENLLRCAAPHASRPSVLTTAPPQS